MAFCLSCDISDNGVKASVYEISDKVRHISEAFETIKSISGTKGEPEQDPEEWWCALCSAAKMSIRRAEIEPDWIEAMTFGSKMQGLVLIDKDLNPIRNALTDPAWHKDSIWKYNWVKDNEKDVYEKIYKCLDIKDYLNARCTGQVRMTPDTAYATHLFDPDKKEWDSDACKRNGVKEEHLPELIKSTDIVGQLREEEARQLTLKAGIPVFGGGRNISLIGVGTGSNQTGKVNIHMGFGGFVSTTLEKREDDPDTGLVSFLSPIGEKYYCISQMERFGKCFEWIRDHLALEEIQSRLDDEGIIGKETILAYKSLMEYMSEVIESVDAGCDGLIFTPWFTGNDCPEKGPKAGGIFFNMDFTTGKSHMVRAVTEGLCYQLKWMLEVQSMHMTGSDTIRVSGISAESSAICQMLSDITGKKVEVVKNPSDSANTGAAVISAVGLGLIKSLDAADECIEIDCCFEPDMTKREVYDRNYNVLKMLYSSNKDGFKILKE